MKTIGLAVLVIFALVGLIGVALMSFNYFEGSRSHFATYAELESSGLIERGWLPPFLPRSATDISESHNISNNSVWATFKYDATDTKTIRGACKVLVETQQGAKYLCPPFEKQTVIVILKVDGTGSVESDENEI